MRPLVSLAALVLFAGVATAQDRTAATARGGTSRTVQPKIMVIPFTKEGEDLRTILEADFNRRVAITKIKEAFDNRGFSTTDFLAVVRQMASDQSIQITAQCDVRCRVIEQSRSDIYVVAEVNRASSGNGVSLILTGFLSANGTSLANKIASAGPYAGDVPYERIVAKAAEQEMEAFLNTMQGKFDEFVANGVPIRVEISVRDGATKKLSTEVGTKKDELSDALEEWMSQNAYKNTYHVSGVTDKRMTFDEVRIPMIDPATNNNYNPTRFAAEIMRYLKTLDVKADRSVGSGGTVYIELK